MERSSWWPEQDTALGFHERNPRETGWIGGQGPAYEGLVGKPRGKLEQWRGTKQLQVEGWYDQAFFTER